MKKSIWELVEKAKTGEDQYLVEIINNFNGTIKKFSRELNYEEAETDLVIGLIEKINTINLNNFKKNDGIIINYIYNSLKNKKIDLFRKYVKGINTEIELNFNITEDISNAQIEDKICMKILLQSLNKYQRTILKYKFINGFSDKEIASKLNISRQAVNRTKNRALKQLNIYLNS